MARVKKRIFAGAVCDQIVYTVSDRAADPAAARPRQRFKTVEERAEHRRLISRRHHARVFNENFGPSSLYSTLTIDDEHEVHTMDDARRLRENYYRRLKRVCPKAKIIIYIGRGKSTHRIHMHMVSDGIPQGTISEKWRLGAVIRSDNLREHNYYNGIDHGQDYTGLANYLFDHWTEEQGRGRRYLQSSNIKIPEQEPARVCARSYSPISPPLPPKGYVFTGCEYNKYGYMCFHYVRKPPPHRRTGRVQQAL